MFNKILNSIFYGLISGYMHRTFPTGLSIELLQNYHRKIVVQMIKRAVSQNNSQIFYIPSLLLLDTNFSKIWN